MRVTVLEHTPKPDQLCGQMAALRKMAEVIGG